MKRLRKILDKCFNRTSERDLHKNKHERLSLSNYNWDEIYKKEYDIECLNFPNIPIDIKVRNVNERIRKMKEDWLLSKSTSKILENIYSKKIRIAEYFAKEMILDMPEELYPNIEEWLNDEEISDILIGELSVKRVMDSGPKKKTFCLERA